MAMRLNHLVKFFKRKAFFLEVKRDSLDSAYLPNFMQLILLTVQHQQLIFVDKEVEDIGYKLTVVEPLVDFYLKHIGVAIRHRLRRSRKTGLTNDFSTTIPWDLMKYICVLWHKYGGTIVTNLHSKKMVLTAVNFATFEKLFSHARFCGGNYLKRQHYVVVSQPKRKNNHVFFFFQGRSAVVVPEKTPFINFRMDYGIAQ